MHSPRQLVHPDRHRNVDPSQRVIINFIDKAPALTWSNPHMKIHFTPDYILGQDTGNNGFHTLISQMFMAKERWTFIPF